MPFYAVRNGKDGAKIYDNWPECQKSVIGVSGAAFKKFASKNEAEQFLVEPASRSETDIPWPENSAVVYTDGSWTKANAGGFAAVFIDEKKDEVRKIIYGPCFKDPEIRNIGGELEAAEVAILNAMQSGYEGITIFHDYTGVQKWADEEWKCKADDTMEYLAFVKEVRTRIQIRFVHVDGHTGVKFNELADAYAKTGAKLSATKTEEF